MKRAYDLRAMVDTLIRHEGLRTHPYRDTRGILTIGIGRNLDRNGISESEARGMCFNDIVVAEADLDRNAPYWRTLDTARQMVVVNMAFNMGWPVFSGFVNFWAALKENDYETAADEMLDSRWARQVGDRAEELAETMRGG